MRTRCLGLLVAFATVAGCAPVADDHTAAEDPMWSPVLQAENQRALTDRTFEVTPKRLLRGEHLANGILQCVKCHSPLDTTRAGHPPVGGREFSGAVLWDDEDGRMVAPNLTPESETGAGSWSDDTWARATREGVGHDGRGLGLPMYWESFRALSDEDLASVVVYLKQVPAIRNTLPPRRLTPAAEAFRASAARPLEEPVPEPVIREPWELGAYLVELGDCVGCHTAWEADPNPGVFGGGNRIWVRDGLPVFSKNLTPDGTGLGAWSAEDFRWSLRTGNGGGMDPIMRWTSFQSLTDAELDAIFAALQRLAPVHHLVRNGVEPTRCEVCGQEHGLGHANRLVADPPGIPLDPELASEYPGIYRSEDWGFSVEVSLGEGALQAREEGGPTIRLVRVDDETYEGRGIPSPIRFERDDAGGVVALSYLEIRAHRFERLPGEDPEGG